MSVSDIDIKNLFQSSDEMEYEEDSEISGLIPKWLNGTFIRTGPGKFDFDDGFCMEHWLCGYAILTRFQIDGKNAKVKYYKKMLKSDAYKRALIAKRPVVSEFGTKSYPDPTKSFFSRYVRSIFPIEFTDNVPISLFQMGSNIFASNDTCYFRKINPDTLETLELYNTNECFKLQSSCAHPIRDENGDIYTIGFSYYMGLKMNIIKIPSYEKNLSSKEISQNLINICTIPSRWNSGVSYVHSFSMTKNYIIFIEQPYVASISKVATSILKGAAQKDWLVWKAHEKNKFTLIEKNSGKIIQIYYSKEPFFFLHIVNSYELDNMVVVDLITYKNPKILDSMYLINLRSNILGDVEQPSMQRYVLPILSDSELNESTNNNNDNTVNLLTELLKKSKLKSSHLETLETKAEAIKKDYQIILSPETLTKKGLEMPCVNKKFYGKKYNTFYASGSVYKNSFSNAIAKVNLSKNETLFWREKEAGDRRFVFPGEPLFIPHPDKEGEEDGVVISAVSDIREDKKDFLVFIDPKSMQEIGRANILSSTPNKKNKIPQSMHGIFINS